MIVEIRLDGFKAENLEDEASKMINYASELWSTMTGGH